MAAGFDDATVGFDDPDYTFNGTFIVVVPGAGLFVTARITARNVASVAAANVVAGSASNTWSN